ncbi:MAG: hypothetical protein J6K96_09825 [Treponema sp.]|nr:hypothetical protein [Treponema sp.]
MNESSGIQAEIVPFVQDLVPGVSAAALVSVLLSVLFAGVLVILCAALFFAAVYIREKIAAKTYLRNLPLIKDLESLSVPPEEKKRLRELVEGCVLLGSVIDTHTNRRNNSKNVSQLVYEILRFTDAAPLDCILFSCAAMVRDAGFLDVRPSLFHSEVLSRKEKESMKSHVSRNLYYIDLIPEEYLSVFMEAFLCHHENQDGSGYPEGLRGNEIPYVARLIHAAESYISLVSRRSYHKVLSKKNALQEMRSLAEKYDPEILDALEKVAGRIYYKS